MTIREHLDARMGFYLWELMIVWDGTRGWGNVHGIFYPDGTIRDPSIPMALLEHFPQSRSRRRARTSEPENSRSSHHQRRTPAGSPARTATGAAAPWAMEVAANLLESAQLVPLHELPSSEVGKLRRGPEDRATLKTLLEKEIVTLQPYE